MEASEQDRVTDRSESPETPEPESRSKGARELPAEDQSPVASDRDKAIVGDSGIFEQQPITQGSAADMPVRTSAPPPSMQSGVPLAEDRAKGVERGGEE